MWTPGSWPGRPGPSASWRRRAPPVFYLPPDDVDTACLVETGATSRCEWKGVATYWTVQLVAESLTGVAWSYPDPFPDFASLRDFVSFYPGRIDCRVAGVRVEAQPGRFYGGWLTPEIVGPVKGASGSEDW